MVEHPGSRTWPQFYEAQTGREPRTMLLELEHLVGPPSTGAQAIDLGCGDGTESRHLVRQGWTVLAIDSAPGVQERVRGDLEAGELDRLTVVQAALEELPVLPPSDLVYAGFSLPFCRPEAFEAMWQQVRAALRPGGVFGGQFFGPRDSWADSPDMSFRSREQVTALADGLQIVDLQEEERDGQALSGPKHWHVLHLLARRSATPPVTRSGAS